MNDSADEIENRSEGALVLDVIQMIAGREGVMAVCRAVGGTRVDIGARWRRDHWLNAVLGEEAARKVMKALAVTDADGRRKGIHHFVVPKGAASIRAVLKERTEALLLGGTSPRRVARLTHQAERTVWRVRADLRMRGLLPPRETPQRREGSRSRPKISR